MFKFLEYLNEVGRFVGDGNFNVEMSDEHIEINGMKYTFSSVIEREFAKILFGNKIKGDETKNKIESVPETNEFVKEVSEEKVEIESNEKVKKKGKRKKKKGGSEI